MSDCGTICAFTSAGTGVAVSIDIETFTWSPTTSTLSTVPAGRPSTRTCDDAYTDTALGKNATSLYVPPPPPGRNEHPPATRLRARSIATMRCTVRVWVRFTGTAVPA